jgi:hypothetical protein
MLVTFPTCQVERSPLKASASRNTAPQQQQRKSPRVKMGWKKKEERALFKNKISAATERRRGNRSSQKETRSWRGRGMYVLAYMVVTFPTCQVERSPLKSPAP